MNELIETCEACGIKTSDFCVYWNEENIIKCRKCYNDLLDMYRQAEELRIKLGVSLP